MRLAFVAILILTFILAPMYLLPRLVRTDSGEYLIDGFARDLVANIPQLPGVESLAVTPLEGDSHKALQFALVDELRRVGKYRVLEQDLFAKEGLSVGKVIQEFRGDNEGLPTEERTDADAILTGSIQRNEISGRNHLLRFQALLVSSGTGDVLWTRSLRSSVTMSGQEWEFKKTALLICLAFAAGILVLYARMEDQKRAICTD